MRRALVLLGLCGCDALFGLDSIDTPIDAPPDTPNARITVTGHATRRWASQGLANVLVIDLVPFPTASPFVIRLADGSVAEHTWDATTGTFTFESGEGERYSIAFQGTGGWADYQLATPAVEIDELLLGHPTSTAPMAAATVEWVTSTTTIPANELRVATMGVWSVTTMGASATPGRYVVTWPNAGFYSAQQPAVLSASAFDSLWILHYAPSAVGVVPSSRVLDSHVSFGNVSTNTNSATTFNGNLGSLARPLCSDIHWNHTPDIQRMTQRHPTYSPSSANGDTRISAVARPDVLGYRIPYELGLVSGGNTNSSFVFQYGNPFGYDVVMLDNAFVSRSVPNIGTLSVNVQYFEVIQPSTNCVRHDIQTGAPIPYAPTLDGAPLVDGIVIGSDGVEQLELKWSIDPADTFVVTQISLIEQMAIGPRIVRNYLTTDNRVFLHPSDIKANTQYRLNIIPNTKHYPDAAAGDLRTRSYPFSLGLMSTGFFTISKPG